MELSAEVVAGHKRLFVRIYMWILTRVRRPLILFLSGPVLALLRPLCVCVCVCVILKDLALVF